jgi:pimeloyl-ACP methyl ester carboxylesterase
VPSLPLSRLTLFFAEKGAGEPLLFLSGLSADHGYWRGQLRAFGRNYRCLAVDNRDAGQSDYAAGPYTVGELAADVAELLDRLQAAPAHVVGLSLGGMIAQELALAHPGKVRSLALVSTLGRSDAWFRGTLAAFGLIRRQVPDTAAFFDAILPWWVSYRGGGSEAGLHPEAAEGARGQGEVGPGGQAVGILDGPDGRAQLVGHRLEPLLQDVKQHLRLALRQAIRLALVVCPVFPLLDDLRLLRRPAPWSSTSPATAPPNATCSGAAPASRKPAGRVVSVPSSARFPWKCGGGFALDVNAPALARRAQPPVRGQPGWPSLR